MNEVNVFELFVRYEQRKSSLLSTEMLANWCHRLSVFAVPATNNRSDDSPTVLNQ